ncbi:Quinol monooxygenase YgiN [Methylophilus rhizosphaerae]|uniref:Quinol monooxygenase YgiN n=1 Tax=Methylophilus rhizosphaerae TaxID=492660 RepID=A0A1G9BUN7_9PROT|nr:Quinol monooxygenase YgiN [Methylophilus rhizosphaerae]
MTMQDSCCSVSPYFEIHPGKAAAFRLICEKYVQWSSREPGCLYYGFSFDGDLAHCREGFRDAAALLSHIENLRPILHEMGEVSELVRMEVHGPAVELARLRDVLAGMHPQYFVLEYGFRKDIAV